VPVPYRLFLSTLVAVLTVLTGLAGCSDGSDRRPGGTLPVALPQVSDPPDEGQPNLFSTTFALQSVGYRQREYFLSGSATVFTPSGTLQPDGVWPVAPAETADYRTRVLVYRPMSDTDFSGSVYVEWLNVTSGFELPVTYGTAHTELLRRGHAIVLLSAQFVGIEGAENPLLPLHLKAVNPARYGSLQHPGDSFSYDILTQVGAALREGGDHDLLEGLRPTHIFAMGQSQSASRLVTYYNAIQPLYGVFDGLLLQNRGASGAKLSEPPQVEVSPPSPAPQRQDLATQLITIQGETDVSGLGSVGARQPDSPVFRLWEVAGTAHNDEYTFVSGRNDIGTDPRFALVVEQTSILGFQECDLPMNSGYLAWTVNAAVRALDDWARSGELPPQADRLELIDDGSAFRLDDLGNVLGGLRTPYVEAPAAVLSGLGQTGNAFCFLFGTTALFDAGQMAGLYVDKAGYQRAVAAAVDDAVAQGFLLAEDGERIVEAAGLQWDKAPP
jgi:hypothetical protein